MKKTLIALIALAGLGYAAEITPMQGVDLKVYTKNDGSIADSIVDQNNYLGNADFYFDSTGFSPAKTVLSSYAFEFKAITFKAYHAGDSNYAFTLFSTSRGDTSGKGREGLSLYSTAGNAVDKVTVGIYSGKATVNDDDAVTGTTYTDLCNAKTITINENDVVRFAYDATSKTAIVFNVTTNKWLEAGVSADDSAYYFESGTETNGQKIGASAVYSQSKSHLLSFNNIADMSVYNGDIKAIKTHIGIVPEPTTATLSLLALAGLAGRRRRK